MNKIDKYLAQLRSVLLRGAELMGLVLMVLILVYLLLGEASGDYVISVMTNIPYLSLPSLHKPSSAWPWLLVQ